jgi:hypothetical protein
LLSLPFRALLFKNVIFKTGGRYELSALFAADSGF